MSPTLDRFTAEHPVALVQSCHSALLWILRSHQSRLIPRYWIDHPYGEEEITLLEEERPELGSPSAGEMGIGTGLLLVYRRHPRIQDLLAE
jgi:hypothetical protein